jgi:type I restriction enzyme M protein
MINDPRYSPAGVLAPKSKADLAFTMHILNWLATNGTAAIVEFPGVMYRGGAEKKIRKYLVDNNFVDTVIQLPPDLFFGTTIQTCILVLKKSKKENKVLFINAEREYARFGKKNKLRPEDIEKVLSKYIDRKDETFFARHVAHEEIAEKDYSLTVTDYVVAEDTREVVDINVLNKSISEIVARQSALRIKIDEIVSDLESHGK